VSGRSSRLPPETSANRRRSFSKRAGLVNLLEFHGPAWNCARAFDLLISRMLEYADAMPTARRGLSWGVCLVAIFAAGCAAKKPVAAPQPEPVQTVRHTPAAGPKSLSQISSPNQISILKPAGKSSRPDISRQRRPRSTARSKFCSSGPAAPAPSRESANSTTDSSNGSARMK
jgi:hypothetical protein